ncbi:MAG: NYN domain-containing protein [Planctomycetota bacterium]|nr:NYN domain-containing protein [Planctomycetota bacterium]
MAKYVYVDNSNVWIEGRKVAAVARDWAFDVWDATNNNILDREWKYDFGKLLELVGGKKNGLKKAMLFGSRPPQNDSLWSAAQKHGFEVVVENRNAQDHEKKIDTGIAVQMVADSFQLITDKTQDEMVLVAGDADYVPALKNIANRGIKITVAFWEHASNELKEAAAGFTSLDQFVDQLRRDKTAVHNPNSDE